MVEELEVLVLEELEELKSIKPGVGVVGVRYAVFRTVGGGVISMPD